MEEILRQRVVGQDDAIEAVARAIRRSRLGVTSPDRPIGSFIFLGPSGVGKTEVARQLASFLFQDPRRLVRFDMSEYMEKHTVSRLIGSPPGYVGFEEGGQLSEQVRRNPYSVVLLDEIEKAHPDIYNLLLQVLEDGRLTDNYGNVIDFTNTLIIMTSNLGGRELVEREGVGFGYDGPSIESTQVRELVDRELRRHFPPEFVNRLDEVIVFDALDEDSMLEVARLLLEETATVLAKKKVSIEFAPDVASWLFDQCGIDPQAGARPLRRLVKLWVEDAVADYLIRAPGRRWRGAEDVDRGRAPGSGNQGCCRRRPGARMPDDGASVLPSLSCWQCLCPLAAAQEEFIIREVVVEGGVTLTVDTVSYYLGLEPEDPLDREAIVDGYRRLWDSGLLRRCADRDRGPRRRRGHPLRRRHGAAVRHFGGFRGQQEDQDLGSQGQARREGRRDSTQRSAEDVAVGPNRNRHQGGLRRRGFPIGSGQLHHYEVSANKKKVVYLIDEGGKIKIKEINFVGNEVFSRSKLRGVLKKTKQKSLRKFRQEDRLHQGDLGRGSGQSAQVLRRSRLHRRQDRRAGARAGRQETRCGNPQKEEVHDEHHHPGRGGGTLYPRLIRGDGRGDLQCGGFDPGLRGPRRRDLQP